jgi:hypothetical protein
MSIKVIYRPRGVSYFPTKHFPMKQEIDINVAAVKAYDAGEYDVALGMFAVRFRY